jgi:hypothetical protein
MQAAVIDPVWTEPAPMPLDFSVADIFYPDIGSALSPVPSDPTDAPDAVAPSFIVDSLAKADWCISRILDAEAHIARRAALASELHARIDAWFQKASAADNDSVSYLSSLLRPYVESEVSTQRRSRSLVLPSGVAQLRKLPDRLDIVDKDAALSYCESLHPEAVVVRKDLAKTELKRLVFSGEAIPGVSAELGLDELYIRANV